MTTPSSTTPLHDRPHHIVVMGVSASGKSTVAELIAERTGWVYADADDFHGPENIAKMNSGESLTDADRQPWLEALAAWIREQDEAGRSTVMACSALKRRYRDVLRSGAPGVEFVHLTAPFAVLRARIAGRVGHFMPQSLLRSQVDQLEPLEADEDGFTLDVRRAPEDVTDVVLAKLGERSAPTTRFREEPAPTVPDSADTGAFLDVNRSLWDSRAHAHASSPDYEVERLLSGPDQLSRVVEFDRPFFGDLTGLDVVHLQCHIGTDTLSLARLGARVTGLDFSGRSIEEARALADRAGVDVEYVESDVLVAPQALGERGFDLVYKGIGAICWLPSIEAWADAVVPLLRPGGRVVIRDVHPMLGALLDTVDGHLAAEMPYFETREPVVWDDDSTYADTDVRLPRRTSHEWNHGLGEIVTALLSRGMELTALAEHDSAPWRPFPTLMAPHPDHPGEYRLAERPSRVAMTFTIAARLRD